MWAFVFTEEMRDLGLTGNDLLVYAVINGYSQGEQGCYYGSREYLCEITGAAERTIKRSIKRLSDDGLIQSLRIEIGGKKVLAYTITKGQNDPTKRAKMAPKKGQNGPQIIKENKNINTGERDARTREKSVPFSAPSVAEVREYCNARRNGIDAEEFVAHYESNGWLIGKAPMKNWKAAVISWEKHRAKEVQTTRQTPKKESAFERALRNGDKMFGTNWHEQFYGPGNPFDNPPLKTQTPDEQ